MTSWACLVCGEEAAADELDPHGHFDTHDVPCTFCDELFDEHFILGEVADHEYESGICRAFVEGKRPQRSIRTATGRLT